MIPLKSELTVKQFPFLSFFFIALCVTVYTAPLPFLSSIGHFVPVRFMHALFQAPDELGRVLPALILSFFSHAGLLHLGSNMWYLWIFGGALENAAGSLAMGGIFLLCGIAATIIQACSTPFSPIPIVGASGAVAGLMGAIVILAPLSRVLIWLPPFFFFRIPSFIFLMGWVVLQYLSMQQNRPGHIAVAWWSHLGGFVTGFLVALELKRRSLFTPSEGPPNTHS